MGDEMGDENRPLSWRDVYKAVGDSEARIVKAINDAVSPLAEGLNDHEARIRAIERSGSATAHDAILKAEEIARKNEALVKRVDSVIDDLRDVKVAAGERRRIGELSTRAVAFLILVVNFGVGLLIVLSDRIAK